MAALPQSPSELPDGFLYYPEFISSEEENELLRQIANLEFQAFDFHGISQNAASWSTDSNTTSPRAELRRRTRYQHFSIPSGCEPRHGPEFGLTKSLNQSSPNTHPARRLDGIATFPSSKSSSEFR
jgi:hypothetical protein